MEVGSYMDCEEFLRQFREALDGKVSEELIQDNVKYYRSYINGQVKAGRSEAEVLAMLGDPRLLAKTIEESSKFANDKKEEQGAYTGNRGAFGSAQGSRDKGVYDYGDTDTHRKISAPGWLVTCIVMVLLVLLFSVGFRLVSLFMPLISLVILVALIYKIFKDWSSSG